MLSKQRNVKIYIEKTSMNSPETVESDYDTVYSCTSRSPNITF